MLSNAGPHPVGAAHIDRLAILVERVDSLLGEISQAIHDGVCGWLRGLGTRAPSGRQSF